MVGLVFQTLSTISLFTQLSTISMPLLLCCYIVLLLLCYYYLATTAIIMHYSLFGEKVISERVVDL